MADTSKILGLVSRLLTQAEDSAATPAEAEAFRERAEGLMRKYRIEEEMMIAVDQVSILPIRSDIELCYAYSEFLQQYIDLSWNAAKHAGVRVTWIRNGRNYDAAFVGYEGDVRLAEYLFTAARLVFAERIEPAINPALSDTENIYRLRSAGITRRRVAELLWNIDTHAAHRKVGETYKAECLRRGERPALDGRGISAGQYREEYAKEFVYSFATRLRRARSAADSTGGAIVLAGREERVAEAFYGAFPHLRPAEKAPATDIEREPTAAEKRAMERREAAALRRAQRGPTLAELAARERRHSAAAMAGRRAGSTAAQAVDLGRGQAPMGKRIDEAPERTRSAIEG